MGVTSRNFGIVNGQRITPQTIKQEVYERNKHVTPNRVWSINLFGLTLPATETRYYSRSQVQENNWFIDRDENIYDLWHLVNVLGHPHTELGGPRTDGVDRDMRGDQFGDRILSKLGVTDESYSDREHHSSDAKKYWDAMYLGKLSR